MRVAILLCIVFNDKMKKSDIWLRGPSTRPPSPKSAWRPRRLSEGGGQGRSGKLAIDRNRPRKMVVLKDTSVGPSTSQNRVLVLVEHEGSTNDSWE